MGRMASETLWRKGSVRRRADLAIRDIDVIADFPQRLTLWALGHHGTRDVDTDPSAKTHRIEKDGTVAPDFLDVAVRV